MVEDTTAETTSVTSDPTTTVPAPGSAADNVTAAPAWVVISLLSLVGVVIVAMFCVTVYNMSSPRSTLKNLLGIRGSFLRKRIPDPPMTPPPSQRLVSALALSAQVNTRTTRTTLAIAGFSLLGLGTVGVLALSGSGVRDLRTQLLAGIVTLVATISGFYFGQGSRTVRSAEVDPTPPAKPGSATAPSIAPDPDAGHTTFTIGTESAWTPQVSGSPTPELALTSDLPSGLTFDRTTGVIAGTALGPPASYDLRLLATNGTPPVAELAVTLDVVA